MATITGSQLAKTYALAGKMRAGAGRAGYTSPRQFVAINGVQYATNRLVAGNQVVDGSVSVVDVLNQTPNTAAFLMRGVEPAEGSDVVIKLGSINNSERLYAGTVINRSHAYSGTPANWTAPVNVIDYTWQLTRRRVSGSFTNVAPAVVAAAIVAAVPGFTLLVAAGLPTLDAFSYTDIDALAALTQLATRCGGYCDVDYSRVVKLFITDTSITAPTALTPAHPTLTAFSWTRDLSQVRTRIFVEGGGVTALAYCAVGETIIPVETIAWYSLTGGLIKSGSQHVIHAGVFAGGGGSLVGPGVGPASPLVPALVNGAGMESGIHLYAVTFVTASGESLASPLATITTGTYTVSPPTTATSKAAQLGGALVNGKWYGYRVTFTTAVGETESFAEINPGFLNATNNAFQVASLPISADPSVTGRKLYRTVGQISSANANAGPWKLAQTIADNTTLVVTDNLADGSLGATLTNVNTASGSKNQVALSAVPIGAASVTSRKIYRTTAGGSQLKLQQTIANNTATTGVTDVTVDASLGANVPTTDTSALAQPNGQALAGATTLLVAGAAAFSASGGWALLGSQVIRYTGISGNTLTGIPTSGIGAITATIAYNTTVTASPALIGVTGIVYPILPGDPVNLLVQVDDPGAQSALATLMGGTDDGVVEDYLQDGTIGLTEALARGRAKLAQCSTARVSIAYDVRDKNSRAGRTIHVALPAPTNLTGDFMIQQVTIDTFQPALMPTFHVQASSDRVSLDDLLRGFRQQAA